MVALNVQIYATLLRKQSDDKSGKLTAEKGPFSVDDDSNVSRRVVSARIRRIGEEPGNLDINPGFGKPTGRTGDEATYRANAVCQSRSASGMRSCSILEIFKNLTIFSFPLDISIGWCTQHEGGSA